MLPALVQRLIAKEDLSADEVTAAIGHIMDGAATPAQIAGFLIALRSKGETAVEILGAARAMRSRMSRITTPRGPVLDTCGTGGDGAGTFNISTAVAFIAAAGGAIVAKHGNRAVSSKSGSADVLAAAGVNIDASLEVVERCLAEVGLGFLFAPARHPAMRHAAPVRKELGVRTIFNLLGPLTNPAEAPYQLLGVFAQKYMRPMAEALAELGSKRVFIVHGADGLDEISVCADTFVVEWTGTRIEERRLSPEELGLPRHEPAALRGGSPEENAATLRELLAGRGPAGLVDAVAANAGAALTVSGLAPDLSSGLSRARELLASGAGLDVLTRLVKLTHG
jgi:anthranilate phosphoribosyltransferase